MCSVAWNVVLCEEELGKRALWNQKGLEGRENKAPLHSTSPVFLL